MSSKSIPIIINEHEVKKSLIILEFLNNNYFIEKMQNNIHNLFSKIILGDIIKHELKKINKEPYLINGRI